MRTRKPIIIRHAKSADVVHIRALQEAAFRIKTRGDYQSAEIESYLTHSGMLQPELIAERTYFVAEIEGDIVAAGGWSTRVAGYASFIRSGSAAPAGSAVIYGVYADPAYAAAGVLSVIEGNIAFCGHATAHVATTYAGIPFFTAAGYKPNNLLSLAFPDGVELHGVVMTKSIAVSYVFAA